MHEIEKQRKQLESEKGNLQVVLHDVEMALEEDEMRLNELTRQIEEVRKDVEDRLRGMDEAFLVTKANHVKAMEKVQEEVEAQSKGKAEAMRARQMHEQTLVELETGLQTTQMKCVELQVVFTFQNPYILSLNFSCLVTLHKSTQYLNHKSDAAPKNVPKSISRVRQEERKKT